MLKPLWQRAGRHLDRMLATPRGAALGHWAGFVLSGGCAFVTDALVLEGLVRFAGLSPLLARLGAICCAMVVGWLAHRTMTFRLAVRPTLKEFLGYAAVAWTSAAINYSAFSAIVLLRPATTPFAALVGASLFAMTFSYLGMRFGAFRKALHLSRSHHSDAP